MQFRNGKPTQILKGFNSEEIHTLPSSQVDDPESTVSHNINPIYMCYCKRNFRLDKTRKVQPVKYLTKCVGGRFGNDFNQVLSVLGVLGFYLKLNGLTEKHSFEYFVQVRKDVGMGRQRLGSS